MKEVKTVGVIGFGVMGSAIGLSAAMSGFDVVFKVRKEEQVQSKFEKLVLQPLNKRVEKNKLTPQERDQITQRIKGTARYEALNECDLIIETVNEKLELKQDIFDEVVKVCSEDAVLVSNTSTFLIEKVMEKIPNPSRTAGLHFFFPANINPLVEVIRQKDTSDDTFSVVWEFALKNQKSVISVKDFPGFAINPVFIAVFMALDSFYGRYNAATLESISKEALGLKYGMMWIQNGTGIGTCYNAAISMCESLQDTDIGFSRVPEQLETCFRENKNWMLDDGPVIEDTLIRQVVIDELLGTIFTLSTHLVEKNIISIDDLENGIKLSLAWPEGPFAMMNRLGMEKTRELIILACYSSGLFKMPEKFLRDIPDPWVMS